MSQCSSCKFFHVLPNIHKCSKGLERVEVIDVGAVHKAMALKDVTPEMWSNNNVCRCGVPYCGDGKCTKYAAMDTGVEL